MLATSAGPAVSSAEASPSVPRDLDAADLNMADPTSRVNADSDGGTAAAAPRTSPGRTIRSAMRSERAVELTKQIKSPLLIFAAATGRAYDR